MRTSRGIAAVAALVGGCMAPVSVGSPERSTTLGSGRVGFTGRFEMPSLNLISDETGDSLRDEGLAVPVAAVEAGYGVADAVDLEVGVEMPTYYFIVPVPNTLWAGARLRVIDNGQLSLAVSGRVGGLVLGKVQGDIETDEEAQALFGSLGASASIRGDGAQPGVAVRYTAYDVSTSGVDNVAEEFDADVATVTGYVWLRVGSVEVAPYVNLARFDSPNMDGDVTWWAGGLAFRTGPGAASPLAGATPF